MTTETDFAPGQRVEWMTTEDNGNTRTYRVGVVMDPANTRLLSSERRAASQDSVVLVRDLFGDIHWVPREGLAPIGTADAQRRQRVLDEALVAVRTAQRALTQAAMTVRATSLEDEHDRDDNSEHFAVAAAHLRDVARTLRLNGAQR